MGSQYLKAIAAGGEFDMSQAIREIAKTLTEESRTDGSHKKVEGSELRVDAPEPIVRKRK